MSINGVTTATDSYASYADNMEVKSKSNSEAATAYGSSDSKKNSEAAVYEKSSKNMSVSDRRALVQKLKADSDSRVSNLKSLVEKMFLKQGQKFTSANDMWKSLANGDLNVDSATASKAQEEISENGYWGVEQTSQRILDFAVSLSGGDEDKMQDMLEAFKKGFSQATKSWGKNLPDICQQTYDSVIQKFEDYGDDEA